MLCRINMGSDTNRSSPPLPTLPTTAKMANDDGLRDGFDFPDADVILRAKGPPTRDFRVHKLVLSIASPVFKEMLSPPQPTAENSDDLKRSDTPELDILEVTDPPDALDIVLRMVYPLEHPCLDGDLDTIVKCLVIANKYDMKRAVSNLHYTLSRTDPSLSLRVYAIASRFGFADLVESTSRHIAPWVNLTETTRLPEDFELIPVAAREALVKRRKEYLNAAVKAVNRTPLLYRCANCPAGQSFADVRLKIKLARLIRAGTPVAGFTCLEAYENKYGRSRCRRHCVTRFILAAIHNAGGPLFAPGEDVGDLYR